MTLDQILDQALADLGELKAHEVQSYNVQKVSSYTDYVIIATGTSSRHVKALAQNLTVNMKARAVTPLGTHMDTDSEWALVDLGQIVVHIMQSKTREYYKLEKMWLKPYK